jgi:uncharacterized membrane protein
MQPSTREYAITTAVFVGALILFGPLTFALLIGAVSILTGAVGLSLGGVVENVVQIAAVLVAVEVVTAIAAIQLSGFDALHQGSRARRLLRHGLLGIAVLAGALVTVSFLVDVVRWSLANGRQSYVAMATLLTIALVWMTIRTVKAFQVGYGHSGGR